MSRNCRIIGIGALALIMFAAQAVSAQGQDQEVIRLNREAMDAYNSLDIDRAASTLGRALELAQQYGVSPGVMAGTYLNLGVVSVAGLGNSQAGLDHFVQACCFDPAIQLDPLLSTPDVQAVFQQAQQQAASGGCPGGPPGQPPPPAPVPVQPVQPAQPVQPVQPVQPFQPPPPHVPGVPQVFHNPSAPQMSQAPLPIYTEITPGVGIERVFLHYKGLGMDQFKRVEMIPFGSGFAYQISCRDVWEPRVRYYITAADDNGKMLATAGTAQSPFEVPIVTQLQGPGASLPGVQPPAPCREVECPPDVSGDECEKPPYNAMGDACQDDSDCQPGLFCEDGVCNIPGAGEWSDDYGGEGIAGRVGTFARMYFNIGFTLGASLVGDGMIADGPPPGDPNGPLESDQSQAFWVFTQDGQFRTDKAWVPDADSIDNYNQTADLVTGSSCPADGIVTVFPQLPSRYCARVDPGGLIMSPALRLSLGYFLTERFAVAGVFRFQFEAGEGSLSAILLGGRAEFMVYGAGQPKGFMASIFAGGTVGQIQPRPLPPEGLGRGDVPFIVSGIAGGHVGGNLRYRFHRSFGVLASPEVDIQLPTFLLNIDLTFGVEASF